VGGRLENGLAKKEARLYQLEQRLALPTPISALTPQFLVYFHTNSAENHEFRAKLVHTQAITHTFLQLDPITKHRV